jgi:hypothetical protein
MNHATHYDQSGRAYMLQGCNDSIVQLYEIETGAILRMTANIFNASFAR